MDLTAKRQLILTRMRYHGIRSCHVAQAIGMAPSNLHRMLSGPSKTERDLANRLDQIEKTINEMAKRVES